MRTAEPQTMQVYGLRCDLYRLADGEGLPPHVHPHEHAILIADGRLIISIEGRPDLAYAAPRCVFVHGGMRHSFRAEGWAVVINITDLSLTDKQYLTDAGASQ